MKTSVKMMILGLTLCWAASCTGRYAPVSLDRQDPFEFTGSHLVFHGNHIELGPKALFVDNSMSEKQAARFPYVYRSLQEALEALTDGTEEEPSCLYIAPGVYWIDDPDDPEIRVPETGGTPYGMVIRHSWFGFYGLTSNPDNVVIACNRGQTQGAEGNFTMFRIEGDGIRCENVTFGNYCNVDLNYALKPSLSRPKRMEAITQAQLILCNSDKVYARNCSFVSRLNSCPFVGSRRAYFENCHFECTDDALCGSAVYNHCDLDFYSTKPFWSTNGTGAVFLDCDFNLLTQDAQYLTKVGSQVALVDCRFHHEGDIRLDWTQYPKESMRCYQYNLKLNGEPVRFNAEDKPYVTVEMEGKKLMNAYILEWQGCKYYNLYGLLRGRDDWDPTGDRHQCELASEDAAISFANLPTQIRLVSDASDIETGQSAAHLKAQLYRFYDVPVEGEILWSTDCPDAVEMTLQNDGTVILKSLYDGEEVLDCHVYATTESGLESAAVVRLHPKTLPSPAFIGNPSLSMEQGKIKVDYTLSLGERQDASRITWYRCADASGSRPVAVSVSQPSLPRYEYTLQEGDAGAWMMAVVEPKHIRSVYGQPKSCVSALPVRPSDIPGFSGKDLHYETDFSDFPCFFQPEIISGAWTVDAYKPLDTDHYTWTPDRQHDAWFYGQAEDGAMGQGLLQKNKGARLMYTPVEASYGDMSVEMLVDPCKTAGQGFGSATGQYMDICLKFDTRSLSGYALRIVRTTKYADAVDFVLMKYENGQTEAISEPVSAICYRTGCHIHVWTEGSDLKADVYCDTELSEHPAGLPKEVHLSSTVEPNSRGGFAVQHTGSTGSSATMFHRLSLAWK